MNNKKDEKIDKLNKKKVNIMSILSFISKKAIYVSVLYEIGKIIVEFRKRKAKKIKIEFHKSTAQAVLYFDDSVYKGIGSSVAADIFKLAYTTLFSKTSGQEEVKESVLSSKAKSALKLNLIPLPKGKVLCYSYTKKQGDIVELAFYVKENNIENMIQEEIIELNEKLSAGKEIVYLEPIEVEESLDEVLEEALDPIPKVKKEQEYLEYEVISANSTKKTIVVEREDVTKKINVEKICLTKKDVKEFFSKKFKVID